MALQKISYERSADLLEQAIADAITSGSLELSNVSGENNGNVKYIEVKTTPNGLQTEFFVSENQVNKSIELELLLRKATGFLKKDMSAQLNLKKLPNLIFIYVTKEQDALRMNKLIDKTIINDQKNK